MSAVPSVSMFVSRALRGMGARDDCAELELLQKLAAAPFEREKMRERLARIDDPEILDDAMRRLRREVMVCVASRDVTGEADFDEVVSTMTALAEETLTAAVRVNSRALARRFGVPTDAEGRAQDMLVVGMGKLGGAELNASSDIDLVFVYDEAGETKPLGEFEKARRSISNHEFFDKLARQIRGNHFDERIDIPAQIGVFPDQDTGASCSEKMSDGNGTQVDVLFRIERHPDDNTDTQPQFHIRFDDIRIDDFQQNIRFDITLLENMFYAASAIENLVIRNNGIFGDLFKRQHLHII